MISLFINSNTTMTNVPTPQQQQVFNRHNDDNKRLNAFINGRWPRQQNAPVVDANMCCLSVSTTLSSTVFLLSIGWDSMFNYNPYSKVAEDPWLISSSVQENPGLASFIREQWDAFLQAIPGNAGQNRINDIAPHVLYDATNAQDPQRVNLTGDGNNVRANVHDIEVWSHPSRDEPLRAVVREMGYSQRLGNVRASARNWSEIRANDRIPDESIRQKRLEQKRQEFQHRFNELWTILQVKLPNSFQWPTIQLKRGQQRFGDMTAGFHDERANKVHNIFPAIGVNPRNTKRHVFNALVEIAGVDFNSLMPEG